MAMRLYTLLVLLSLFFSTALFAQQADGAKLSAGLELDFLPYATGGYFAGGWAGKGHVRLRALTARVHKPAVVVKKGFTNNDVTAYALVVDYFLEKDWKGWWAATGLVHWKSSIQSDARLSTRHYENYLLNGSLGYNFPLSKSFYLSPWAGMHLRLGGDKHFTVDGKDFTAPMLNPEASLKLGWRFR